MGSQAFAKIPRAQGEKIRSAIAFQQGAKATTKRASSIASEVVGPLTKTNAFVQCLSSKNVESALKYLIEFSNKFKFKDAPPAEILAGYGIPLSTQRPLAMLIANVQKQLKEKWTAQQQATDSATALEDAIPRTIMDVLTRSMTRTAAMSATRDQIAKGFAKIHAKEIARTLYENTIASLVDQALDAARGQIPPSHIQDLKNRIRQKFAPKLAGEIDRIASERGISPSNIPRHIPKWTDRLENIIERYKD
jgi:hypothetical protein